MRLSRRRFVGITGGVATTLATLPMSAEVLTSIKVAETMADGPIRLDRNENPYGPSPKVLEAMRNALNMANRYPVREYSELAQRIAAMHNVQPERVLLGCGSGEILRVAAVGLLGPGKKFVQASPTYETAESYARLAGADVISVALNQKFEHDLDHMLARIDAGTPLVYICNPNNPTGSLTPRSELETFIAKLQPTTAVLIDEAYHHYALGSSDYTSFLDHPIGDDRIIVARTFSKVYGLAGMRLGYAVAAPKVIAKLRPHITPVNVNELVVQAGFAALDDAENVTEGIRTNEVGRKEFFHQATARGLKPIPSYTNFVMTDVHRPTQDVVEYFRTKGVLIGRKFPPLETYIRVSLGKPEEMKEFWRGYDAQPKSSSRA